MWWGKVLWPQLAGHGRLKGDDVIAEAGHLPENAVTMALVQGSRDAQVMEHDRASKRKSLLWPG